MPPVKSLYAACLSRLGLSQAGAAALHRVDVSTIKHWSSGRRTPPVTIWEELRDLEARTVDASEAIREAWEDAGEPASISASWQDDTGLMALADFVLSAPVIPQ